MKKMCLQHMNDSISLEGGEFLVVFLENSHEFYSLCYDLYNQVDMSNTISFFSNGKRCDIDEDIDYSYNLFDLNLNSRKIQNALIKNITVLFESNNYMNEIDSINSYIADFFKNKLFDFDLRVTFNSDMSLSDYLKLIQVRLEDDVGSLLERVVNYMEAINKLKHIDTFIFTNLLLFLDEEEIKELQKHVEYRKYNLVLLESNSYNKEKLNCKFIIIDKEGCVLL